MFEALLLSHASVTHPLFWTYFCVTLWLVWAGIIQSV